jgi:uncharacterized UPF0160 family protein
MTDLRKAAKEVVLAWSWDASEPRNKAVREAMERLNQVLNVDAVNMSQERVDETAKHKHEPVGYVTDSGRSAVFYAWIDIDDDTPLYTAPREWVGLTHEEKHYLNDVLNLQGRFAIIEVIEAKLKEKNT